MCRKIDTKAMPTSAIASRCVLIDKTVSQGHFGLPALPDILPPLPRSEVPGITLVF
jgi:hypothetical protein